MLNVKKALEKILEAIIQSRESSLGEWIDLSSYNSASKKYTFPCDGYVFVYNASNASSYLSVLGGVDEGSTVAIGGQNQRHALYVRKGMTCYVTGTLSGVRFSPIIGGVLLKGILTPYRKAVGVC